MRQKLLYFKLPPRYR